MPITIYPTTESFAAEIGDVDVSQPLSADDVNAIKAAFWKYAVLIFPDQCLSADQHVLFAQLFGPLEVARQVGRTSDGNLRLRPELVDPSNLDADNSITAESSRLRMTQLANRLWHTDSSFRHVPAQASLLYSRTVVPVGGHTAFADMRAAWDSLPDSTRQRIEDLVVEHWFMMHRGTEFDDLRWRRDLQRATVCDVGNTIDVEPPKSAQSSRAARAAQATAPD